ncbi:DUF2130 domain-containing protein [Candidatus Saccharibacteria bacterium]|nr:DUF2130 domain-containing protein [Candidatus Saccharibacteria bacterium]NCU40930.1 DUF2130 domain-containing protein [Candidatus Saccharibacteria bacterium]
MNEITCDKCGNKINIDKALAGQIEARIIADEHKKHEEEIARVKEQAAEFANDQLKAKLELADQKKNQEIELERERVKIEYEGKAKKEAQESELLLKSLRDDAESAKEDNKKLREQLSELMDALRQERKAKESAELDAKKKLAEEESKIREESKKLADEEHRLKQLEKDKTISDLQKSIEEMRRKAEQGSQQNQGEVLELDLENELRLEFPLDELSEVKKGQRGADIIQVVKNHKLDKCGLLLWESKNAAWQPAWIAKFKEDIRNANANIGIIVSKELPSEYGDMKHIDGGVWVVKPKLTLALAAAMRHQIIGVHTANHNSVNKDEKMEVLFHFLTGPEFRHRIESIVENYSVLQTEIEREKRTTALRWARQEKSIRAVIDNTFGMYGDLQGITGGAMSEIKQLEPGDDETDVSDS